jgi:hypothetical protein
MNPVQINSNGKHGKRRRPALTEVVAVSVAAIALLGLGALLISGLALGLVWVWTLIGGML